MQLRNKRLNKQHNPSKYLRVRRFDLFYLLIASGFSTPRIHIYTYVCTYIHNVRFCYFLVSNRKEICILDYALLHLYDCNLLLFFYFFWI